MSEFMESTGKTVDEAVREALLRMGLRREEVEVTVIQKERGGILGVGRRNAVVRVEKKAGGRRGGSGGGRSRRDGEGDDNRGERLDGGRSRGSRGGRRSSGRGRDRDQDQDSRRAREQGGRGRDQDGRGGSQDDGGRDQDSRGRGRGRGRGRRDEENAPRAAGERRDENRDRNSNQNQRQDRDNNERRDEQSADGTTRRRRRRRRRKPAAEVESAVNNPVGDGRMFNEESGNRNAPEQRQEEAPKQAERPRRAPAEVAPEVAPETETSEVTEVVEVAEVADTVEVAETTRVVAEAPAAAPRAAGGLLVDGQVATARVAAFTEADLAPMDGFLERVATDLMVKSGFPCRVRVQEDEYFQVKMVVDDRSAGVLIGRHGATVDAVESLVEKIASHTAGDRVRMNLDINNYRLRRHDSIEERARNAATEAMNTGEPVSMAPMHGRERRLVHLEIEDMEELVTYTEDSVEGKYVVICRPDQVPAHAAPSTGSTPEVAEEVVEEVAEEVVVEAADAAADETTIIAPETDIEPVETAAVIVDDDDDEEPRRLED